MSDVGTSRDRCSPGWSIAIGVVSTRPGRVPVLAGRVCDPVPGLPAGRRKKERAASRFRRALWQRRPRVRHQCAIGIHQCPGGSGPTRGVFAKRHKRRRERGGQPSVRNRTIGDEERPDTVFQPRNGEMTHDNKSQDIPVLFTRCFPGLYRARNCALDGSGKPERLPSPDPMLTPSHSSVANADSSDSH